MLLIDAVVKDWAVRLEREHRSQCPSLMAADVLGWGRQRGARQDHVVGGEGVPAGRGQHDPHSGFGCPGRGHQPPQTLIRGFSDTTRSDIHAAATGGRFDGYADSGSHTGPGMVLLIEVEQARSAALASVGGAP